MHDSQSRGQCEECSRDDGAPSEAHEQDDARDEVRWIPRQCSTLVDLEGSGSARPASVSVTATLRDANVVRSTYTTSLRVALLDQRLY